VGRLLLAEADVGILHRDDGPEAILTLLEPIPTKVGSWPIPTKVG
jgi:hypothetical protein